MVRLLKLLIFFISFIAASICYTQSWISTHSSSISNDLISEDKAYSIVVTNSGFVYVTGFCSTDSNGTDICTIKYDESGDTLWTKFYNGSGNSEDKAYAIVVDEMDNVVVTGHTTGFNNNVNIITIKYSASGDLLWTKTYNGSANSVDKSEALCIDQSGCVYVTGYATNQYFAKDLIVIKYSPNGTLLWTYTYNYYWSNRDDAANAIALDSQGNVLVTGYSMHESDPGSEDIITAKLDSYTGSRIWSKRYAGPGDGEDKAYAIVIDDLDNIFITGHITNGDNNKDIVTIKYSSYGYQCWVNIRNQSGYDDYAKSIALTPDNGVVITGTSKSGISEGTENYITIKYNTNGDILWVKTYEGISTDVSYSLVVSEDDNSVFVTGSSKNDTSAGSEDMFTIEYDLATGTLLDSSRLDAAGGEDVAVDIAIDTAGNIFITGYTEPLGDNITSATDYITVKYTNIKTFGRRNSKTPAVFILKQNYPNPFNPRTRIDFSIGQKGQTKLSVYDILGKEVAVLINGILIPGEYSAEINGDNLASGIYFYELIFNEYRSIKKMILIK